MAERKIRSADQTSNRSYFDRRRGQGNRGEVRSAPEHTISGVVPETGGLVSHQASSAEGKACSSPLRPFRFEIRSKLKPSPKLNASRGTYVAAPHAKAAETLPRCAGQRRSADVIVEGSTISADREIAVIDKHVLVERVVELGSDLQVHPFSQSRILGN